MMNDMNSGWEIGYGWFFVIIAAVVVIGLLVRIICQQRNRNRLKYKSPMEIIKDKLH
jgi:heme/copper-type cytochrome/quinol oxidase subunit 4